MKHNTNKLNIKIERNIMSTNSTNSDGITDAAGFAVAPGPGRRLLKCKALLWLALPLTLAVGCASNPNRAAVTDNFFTDAPSPAATTFSESQAVNRVVGREIFNMFLADKNINYSLMATVNNDGAVTLSGASFDGTERQRVVDRMWELDGVNQVKNEQGVNLAPTPATKAVAVR
jgi:hypothetical protein